MREDTAVVCVRRSSFSASLSFQGEPYLRAASALSPQRPPSPAQPGQAKPTIPAQPAWLVCCLLLPSTSGTAVRPSWCGRCQACCTPARCNSLPPFRSAGRTRWSQSRHAHACA